MRFEVGNKYGCGRKGRSGRKPRIDEVELQGILTSCWRLKDRRAAIKKLASMACNGDLAAITLLMSYAYGRPRQAVELDGRLDLPQTVELHWPDVQAVCEQQGLDEELVKHEARRLLEEAEAEGSDEWEQ